MGKSLDFKVLCHISTFLEVCVCTTVTLLHISLLPVFFKLKITARLLFLSLLLLLLLNNRSYTISDVIHQMNKLKY